MFIFDAGFGRNINANKLREIHKKQWKEGDNWKSKTLAYYNDEAEPIEIAENEVILSFYPAPILAYVISCWWDSDTKTSFIDTAPIIGWVEVLDNGIQPFTSALEVPSRSPYHRWGIRVWERNEVTEPGGNTYDTVETFQKSCDESFDKK